MALRPDEFYDHALAAADGEQRLPLARMTEWEISPFEQGGLRVAPLRPPVMPEPARHGEDPSDCNSCRNRDKGIWFNERWRLTRIGGVGVPLALMLHPRDHYDLADLPDELAAELGVLTSHVVRHVEALAHVARAHVYRLGDGGAHLHVWFFARPEGQAQLLGSWLVVWDDLLPEYPADVADADAAIVADALVTSYGGTRSAVLAEPQALRLCYVPLAGGHHRGTGRTTPLRVAEGEDAVMSEMTQEEALRLADALAGQALKETEARCSVLAQYIDYCDQARSHTSAWSEALRELHAQQGYRRGLIRRRSLIQQALDCLVGESPLAGPLPAPPERPAPRAQQQVQLRARRRS